MDSWSVCFCIWLLCFLRFMCVVAWMVFCLWLWWLMFHWVNEPKCILLLKDVQVVSTWGCCEQGCCGLSCIVLHRNVFSFGALWWTSNSEFGPLRVKSCEHPCARLWGHAFSVRYLWADAQQWYGYMLKGIPQLLWFTFPQAGPVSSPCPSHCTSSLMCGVEFQLF